MLYEDKYLTVSDEATQLQYYDMSDPDTPMNQFPYLTWDIIGTIYEPGTYDEEGNQLTAPVAKPGWHVNICYDFRETFPAELTQYEIADPATPHRIRPILELTEKQRKNLSVSRLQADKMMTRMGIKATVENWITTQTDDIQAAYNLAYRFERNDALWEIVKTAFGWSDKDLDRLFVRAGKL